MATLAYAQTCNLSRLNRVRLPFKKFHWSSKCHPDETERPAVISPFGYNQWHRVSLALSLGLSPLAVQSDTGTAAWIDPGYLRMLGNRPIRTHPSVSHADNHFFHPTVSSVQFSSNPRGWRPQGFKDLRNRQSNYRPLLISRHFPLFRRGVLITTC